MDEQKVLRIIAGILFVVLFVSLAIYIPYEYFYYSKIHNLRLSVGDKYILNVQNDDYTFVSSNEEVAIVDNTGVINILDFGTAKVTVKDKNNKMKYRYDITVEYNNETSLELYPTQLELKTGDTYKLIHKYISTSEPKEIKWESSNTNVVTVDNNGVVKGISNGTSTIRLTIDGLEKDCVVNVSAVNNKVEPNYDVDNNKPAPVPTPVPTPVPQPDPVPQPTPGPTTISVTGVSLSKSKLDLNVGSTTVVTATVTPSNATNRTVTWESSNNNVATVSNGVIKAVGVGSANITVKTNDGGKTATVKVTVLKQSKPVVTTNKEEEVKEVAVESISSSITAKSIYVSETYQIVTVITPSDAKTNLTYKSSNTKVATVSDKGKVTGLSKGNAVITVTSTNNKTYNINITVNELVISPTKKTYKATIVGNGANVEKDNLSCDTVGMSCKVTLPNITRSGYNIIGYSTNQNATTAEYKVGTTIDLYNDTTLYAITSKGVTATFLPNEYVSTTKVGCTMYNANTSCRLTTPNISRANYEGLGFSTDSNARSGSVGSGSDLYISSDATYYAITRINQDGVLQGCTGWAAGSINYYSAPNSYEGTLNEGQAFTIEELNGAYFKVTIPGKTGYKYVLHSNVMINLPDYIPSISYNITNASASIYKTSGMNIPGITGTKLYNTGKVYNPRLRRDEYMAPMIYSTANLVLAAQNRFKNDGYRLKIYDSYRPHTVTVKIYNGLKSLYDSNATVKENIDYSTGASGRKYYWGPGYFLAQGVSRHNLGIALDATLTNSSYQELQMPTAMHELSTKAIKYYSGEVAKVPANYSKEMNDLAKYYDGVMTSVGFNTISGEWWHFQENAAANRTKSCNFYPTGVYSY